MLISNNVNKILMYPSQYIKNDLNRDIFNLNQPSNNCWPSFQSSKTDSALKAQILVKPQGYREICAFNVPFYEKGHLYELTNGQKVVIIPKHGPTVIRTSVKAGFFTERDSEAGYSHFVEHSLFNGSKDLKPGQFENEMEKIGAFTNADTDYDVTCYYVVFSGNNTQDLEKIISMHANMLQYPVFSPDMIEKEKPIVLSEIETNDAVQEEVFKRSLKNLLQIDTPRNGDLVLGPKKNIKDITDKKLSDYFNRRYSPDNMTTVLVGNVNPNQAIKIISKYFDKPKSLDTENNKVYKKINPIQKTVREEFTHEQLEDIACVQVTFVGPQNSNSKEIIALEALQTILCEYRNARFIKAFKKINTDIDVYSRLISSKSYDPQVIFLEGEFKSGQEEKGIKIINDVIQGLVSDPPSEKEILIAKNKLIDNLNIQSEYSIRVANLANIAAINNKDLKYYSEYINTVNSLTSKDLQNAAKKYLDMNKASIVVVRPEDKTAKKSVPNKSKAVSFAGKTNNTYVGKIEEIDLPNNVHLVINDDSHTIRTSAKFELAVDNIPDINPAVTKILGAMLQKGTKDHNEDELNDLIDINCLTIGSFSDFQSLGTEIECTNERFPLALNIAKEILLSPEFTQKDFKTAKKEIKEQLSGNELNALEAALEIAFPDHHFGYSNEQILDEIAEITLDDIKEFYNYILKNPKVKVVITGPISKTQGLKAKIIETMSSPDNMPPVKKYRFARNTSKSEPLTDNELFVTAKNRNYADIVQLFKIKETGEIKDLIALKILNSILGEDSYSRLHKDLRESKGLAYEVESVYDSDKTDGYIALNIKTLTEEEDDDGDIIPKYENIKLSLDGFKEHINRIIQEKVTSEELCNNKKALINALGAEIESSMQKTSLVNEGFNTKYGVKYIPEFLKAIDEVNEDDIQRVAEMYLSQPSMISIIANKNTLKNTKKYLESLD